MTRPPRTHPALDLRWPPRSAGTLAIEEKLSAALCDLDVAAVEEFEDSWRVFFSSPEARDRAAGVLAAGLASESLTARVLDVPDENWAERSQATLGRISLRPFIIAPPWDLPTPAELGTGIVLVIEPSMGFGTGHHPTTRLCLRALASLDLAGRSFLDVGTGSGILAVAACRLGATPVVAIDSDPDAIESARRNLALNGVAGSVRLLTDDFRLNRAIRATTVVANLTGGMLVRDSEALVRTVESGGLLVAGGFTRDEAEPVHAALALFGSLVSVDEEDEWCAATVRIAAGGGPGDAADGRRLD